ncbi:MAG: hypothetical protein IPJ88_08820 [Myxococcales bacterium]|nr:MAG: hypothetical protein IPJ88_08820 [Myxococcales bacterium]
MIDQQSSPEMFQAARRALEQADLADEHGDVAQARMHLRVVEWALPHLEDRFALRRAELLMKEGHYPEACRAFSLASTSPESRVIVEARMGQTRCLLEAHDKGASTALNELVKRYPNLPNELLLKFKLAKAKKSWGDIQGAVNAFRSIDLNNPGHPVAKLARVELQFLHDEGIPVRDYSIVQRIARAELLLRSGPFDLARSEIDALLNTVLSARNRASVTALAAQLARYEGRFEDSQKLLKEAQKSDPKQGAIDNDEAAAIEEEALATEAELGKQRIDQILRRRPYVRLSFPQLKLVLEIATAAGIKESANQVLEALLSTRRSLWPTFRFEMAVLATGNASDELIIKLLAPMLEDRRLGLAARYHYARALERSGQKTAATKAFVQVVEQDDNERPYYKLWAEQRLSAMCKLEELKHINSREALFTRSQSNMGYEQSNIAFGKKASQALRNVITKLSPLVREHDDAFPWLRRARDLMRLGEMDAANDELVEVYRAWRSATGRKDLRMGLASVYKGRAVRLGWPDVQTKRARMALDVDDRRVLADASIALGDYGTAIALAGWNHLSTLPRPFTTP